MDECTTVRHKHLSKLADHLLQSSNISQSSKHSHHSDIDDAVNAAMQGQKYKSKQDFEEIWENNIIFDTFIKNILSMQNPDFILNFIIHKVLKINYQYDYEDMQYEDIEYEDMQYKEIRNIIKNPIKLKNFLLSIKDPYIINNIKYFNNIIFIIESFSISLNPFFKYFTDDNNRHNLVRYIQHLEKLVSSPQQLRDFLITQFTLDNGIIERIKNFNQLVFNKAIQENNTKIVEYYIKNKMLIHGFDKDTATGLDSMLELSPIYQALSTDNYEIFVKLVGDDVSLLHKKYYLPIENNNNTSTPIVYCNKVLKKYGENENKELVKIRNYILTKIGRNFLFSTKKKIN